MDETFKEKSWNTLQKWWYRFIKRYFIAIRNYLDKIQEYLFYNIKLSKYNFELNSIANIDETPLYLNMFPSATVLKLDQRK